MFFKFLNNLLFILILAPAIFGVSIRPLETLHNALSLKQLDTFLEKMTNYVPKIPNKTHNLEQQVSVNVD